MSHRLVVLLLSSCLATAAFANETDVQPEWRTEMHRFFSTGSRGFLGVQVQGLTPELRTFFGAPKEQGVLIAAVSKETPATRAGLKVGDVIITVGNKAIRSPNDLVHEIGFRSEGEQVDIEVIRADRSETLTVTLAERPMPSFPLGYHRSWTSDPEETTEKRLQQLEGRLRKLEEARR